MGRGGARHLLQGGQQVVILRFVGAGAGGPVPNEGQVGKAGDRKGERLRRHVLAELSASPRPSARIDSSSVRGELPPRSHASTGMVVAPSGTPGRNLRRSPGPP